MKRLTLLLSCLILTVGFALFQLKYQVLALEKTHRDAKKSCEKTVEDLNVLKAEWEYLNTPQRLQLLSARYLELRPVGSKQIVSLRDITSGEVNYDSGALDRLISEVAADTKI
ncbi:MAG: hypothetical protein WCG04_04950, partial [Alphaproteobacteria bacterium]